MKTPICVDSNYNHRLDVYYIDNIKETITIIIVVIYCFNRWLQINDLK